MRYVGKKWDIEPGSRSSTGHYFCPWTMYVYVRVILKCRLTGSWMSPELLSQEAEAQLVIIFVHGLCMCVYVRPCHFKILADWLMDVSRIIEPGSRSSTGHYFCQWTMYVCMSVTLSVSF